MGEKTEEGGRGVEGNGKEGDGVKGSAGRERVEGGRKTIARRTEREEKWVGKSSGSMKEMET